MHIRLTALLLLASAMPALADCPNGTETFMSCTFKNGAKSVAVCAAGNQVSYIYGPTNAKPELFLQRSAVDVDYSPWAGFGRSIWESVVFYNGVTSYEVYGSIDKMMAEDDPATVTGGIIIAKNGETLAELICDPASVNFDYNQAMLDAKEAAGQCLDLESREWAACQ